MLYLCGALLACSACLAVTSLSHLAIKLTCWCEKLPLLSFFPASPVCNSLLMLVCLIHFVLYFQQRLEISFLLTLKVLNSSIFLPLLILLLYF